MTFELLIDRVLFGVPLDKSFQGGDLPEPLVVSIENKITSKKTAKKQYLKFPIISLL